MFDNDLSALRLLLRTYSFWERYSNSHFKNSTRFYARIRAHLQNVTQNIRIFGKKLRGVCFPKLVSLHYADSLHTGSIFLLEITDKVNYRAGLRWAATIFMTQLDRWQELKWASWQAKRFLDSLQASLASLRLGKVAAGTSGTGGGKVPAVNFVEASQKSSALRGRVP